jgi:acetyltransferase-like isoleucine patch superfamily enzyme
VDRSVHRRFRGIGHKSRLRFLGPMMNGPASRLHVSDTAGLANVVISTVGGSVDIGEYVFFGIDVLLLTGTHDFRLTGEHRQANRPPSNRDIVIEAGAWIASRAVIIGPCRIGANSVIGCGCVVDFDVQADTIVRVKQEVITEPIQFRGHVG